MKKSSGTLYWGGGPLAESDLSGILQREFIFVNGRRIARRDINSIGGPVHYYFTDHLGSTDIVTSEGGGIQNDSDYYPYGGERVYTQTLANQNYKFTGKERDTESGLDNFGARYDSSNLGRFMTPDWAARPTTVPYATFGDPQSLNLYGYVRNDPVSLADADGHFNNDQSQQCDSMRLCIWDAHSGASLLDAFLASIMRARAGVPLSVDSPLDSDGYSPFEYSAGGKTYGTFGEAASALQAQQQPQPQAQNQLHLTRKEERELAALAVGEQATPNTAQHEAIISVAINRANTPDRHGHRHSIHQVIHQRNAFQGVNSRRFSNVMSGRSNRLPGVQDAMAAVREVERNGTTTNATYFYHGEPDAQTLHNMAPNVTLVPANPGAIGDLHLYIPQ